VSNTNLDTRTQVLDAVLSRAVVLATGKADAKPRTQQRSLAHQLWEASESESGRAITQAPTGTGKSLAYLAVVMLRAALNAERAVISTESLSLQAQVVDKDAPVVAAAVKEITGADVTYALMKGWSNYVCLKASAAEAETLLEHGVGYPGTGTLWDKSVTDLEAGADTAPIVAWAMRAGADATATGDRHTYPDILTEDAWSTVSVSPAECVGVTTCPFAAQCKPAIAKQRAAAAAVIVTNHALLAVQAAHQVAAVVGSRTLGPIDTIVVDEAHGLPGQVRSQGAGEVSARRVTSLVKAVERLISDEGGRRTVADHLAAGNNLAALIANELATNHAGTPGTSVRLTEADPNPAAGFETAYSHWLDRSVDLVKTYTATAKDQTTELRVRRFTSRIQGAKKSLSEASKHTPGVARWIEILDDGSRAIRYSPVDVSTPLDLGLWTVADPPDDDAEPLEADSDVVAGESTRAVLAVSATIPASFPADSGLRIKITKYGSPLVEALEGSALFVPPAVDPVDVAELSAPGSTSTRPRFDTKAHTTWASRHITELVEANGGRALILAATAAAGKQYAQTLRDLFKREYTVLDQWSGRPLRQVVAEWREDETGVLVGTRSLMTGVDAPGDTCSLVVLDRIPRSPSNAVDDARVEDWMGRLGVNKWAADRSVYASDAALLLEQAVGRLIRSSSDRGLVAVLDPRLRSARGSAFTYHDATRSLYLDALRQFGQTLVTLDEATAFLTGLRTGK